MRYVQDDGGRAAAGFKGTAGDCGVRALAISAGLDYRAAYDLAARHCRQERPSKRRRGVSSPRTGIHTVTFHKIMAELGWRWTPTMTIGSGCRVHLRDGEIPSGRLIVNLSRHYAAVIDGEVHDTHDPRRGGDRCVYGYWSAN
jgi:hypothetical protein